MEPEPELELELQVEPELEPEVGLELESETHPPTRPSPIHLSLYHNPTQWWVGGWVVEGERER